MQDNNIAFTVIVRRRARLLAQNDFLSKLLPAAAALECAVADEPGGLQQSFCEIAHYRWSWKLIILTSVFGWISTLGQPHVPRPRAAYVNYNSDRRRTYYYYYYYYYIRRPSAFSTAIYIMYTYPRAVYRTRLRQVNLYVCVGIIKQYIYMTLYTPTCRPLPTKHVKRTTHTR